MDLALWFWLRVSRDAVVRCWFRLRSSQDSTGAGVSLVGSFACLQQVSGLCWVLAGNISSSPHGSLTFPRARDLGGRGFPKTNSNLDHTQRKTILEEHEYWDTGISGGHLRGLLLPTIFKFLNYYHRSVIHILQPRLHFKYGSKFCLYWFFFLFLSFLHIHPLVIWDDNKEKEMGKKK